MSHVLYTAHRSSFVVMTTLAELSAEVARLREQLHAKLNVDFAGELEKLKTMNELNQEKKSSLALLIIMMLLTLVRAFKL
jgi:hypothetical protein